jgi:hypothetical protein
MTETLVGVSPPKEIKKSVSPAEQELAAARELVRAALARGVALTGPDGLLKAITKTVLESALEEEMSEHLGYDKHAVEGRNGGNSRNGTRAKTVLTKAAGEVQVQVPRDRAGSFEPVVVKKRQRRLSNVDAVAISGNSVQSTTFRSCGWSAYQRHLTCGRRTSPPALARRQCHRCAQPHRLHLDVSELFTLLVGVQLGQRRLAVAASSCCRLTCLRKDELARPLEISVSDAFIEHTNDILRTVLGSSPPPQPPASSGTTNNAAPRSVRRIEPPGRGGATTISTAVGLAAGASSLWSAPV